MTWAKLSAGLEPVALDRRIIGIDTFGDGFPGLHPKDSGGQNNAEMKAGGLAVQCDVYEELQACIEAFDGNRFLNQFPKVQLVRGDACKTIPALVEEQPHLLVSLLFMDFDVYEPTKVALEHRVRWRRIDTSATCFIFPICFGLWLAAAASQAVTVATWSRQDGLPVGGASDSSPPGSEPSMLSLPPAPTVARLSCPSPPPSIRA